MTWKLPGYVIDDLLGFGASGEVWRGKDVRTGSSVALKRVPMGDRAQVQAARAEAALLSNLDHPHLLHLHELIPSADAVVLVLDLAGGGSLTDLLRQRGRLTPGEVITALAPIGAALAYAHNEGVVHGDVSTGNVLFTDLGLPLLADLGVARIVGDDRPVRSTPAYIDPAVANGYAPGPSSDVFSLAAVAVHALRGEPLWSGVSTQEMLSQAAHCEIDDFTDRVGDVPDEMRAVLGRALLLEPHLRCTAAEFALDLRHSGVPTPVELAAGRPRQVPPAQKSVSASEDGLLVLDGLQDGSEPAIVAHDGAISVPRSGFDRPGFDRPGFDRAGVRPADPGVPRTAPGQLTHGARIAAQHRTVGTAKLPTRWRGHRLRWTVLAACTVATVLAVTVWATVVSPRVSPRSRQDGATPASATPGIVAPPEPADATAVAMILKHLDDVRQNAFARGDSALLAQVYLPGQLLTQDTSALARSVPAGCSLIGVHTSYVDVRLAASPPGRTMVLATATLAASTLMCDGVNSGAASGRGPTELQIELVARAGAYVIAAQQIVS